MELIDAMKRARIHGGMMRLIPWMLSLGPAVAGFAAEPTEAPWPETKQKYLQASRDEHNIRSKTWTEVAGWNFDDGVMPAEFKAYEGEWTVDKGSLWASGGKKDRSRSIKIADCRWPAFRIEFDAMLQANPGADPDRLSDIGIRFNADPATGAFAKGYSVITGQYGNQATVLYRLNIPYARTEWSPIVPGKRHHIALEVVSPHIRLWVDGRIVLDAWERRGLNNRDLGDFMTMDPSKVIALCTYDNLMEVDNLRILVPPEKEGQAAVNPATRPSARPSTQPSKGRATPAPAGQ